MPLQISIGDAILLAQIAWQLGQAFTHGRQSAPVEFREVENELYSLSTALTAAENEQDSAPPSADHVVPKNNQLIATQDIFAHIIQNCKHTLAQLEELVKKYMIVSEQTDPQRPKLERWSHSIVKNWRKIEWTTEKGDLNTLRSQIMVHTNSLNLLVSIGTSSRAASIERSLDKKLVLLEELHQWYVDNLKETKPKRSATSSSLTQTSETTTHAQFSDIISTFELTKKNETGDEIICPCASIRNEWIESFLNGALDPKSGSIPAFKDTGSVESITFKNGGTHHIQEWVTDVQILQYGVLNLETSIGNAEADLIRSLEYAEILISFDASEAQERSDVVSMILKLRRNTTTVLTEKAASLEIKSIDAVRTHADDERTTSHNGLDVIIQFTTKSAAKEFHDKIESMRMELFVKGLQHPRSNEKVVLNLQTAKVECESVYIDDAEITIVMDEDAKYRLIIASRNGCTIISQVLVEDFFTSPSNGLNFTGSTYLVQIGDTGERKVYHYKKGFRHLNLSTTQGQRSILTHRTTNS
ncbi:hypothetical protein E0Z10_g5655 [Xylaria hypoxylon]|uniref:Fungal N-terminal domain-containing protein n=1 Tax=Xylaria hypoxylon TaxID=37992 RepID=A0A4Z0YI27_9PEZI|nr:hypothetical protein E0Z10_g5655 [Xylaria hypoxylon]